MHIDLHSHTSASDGSLSAAELVRAAADAGVTMLAITDHDTTAGFDSLQSENVGGLNVIAGIEFSSRWRRHGIHILGLNIDTHNAAMQAACASQSAARDTRAHAIAARLAKLGIKNSYAGASGHADGGAIGRPHFAKHLLDVGAVRTHAEAFKKYLGNRHEGTGVDHWAEMEQIVSWITAAGGCAVLAHPYKYKLTRTRLANLVADFAAAGGHGLEVVSGQQTRDVTDMLANLARGHDLLASMGSDFHQPGMSWAALGHFSALPTDLKPVWQHW